MAGRRAGERPASLDIEVAAMTGAIDLPVNQITLYSAAQVSADRRPGNGFARSGLQNQGRLQIIIRDQHAFIRVQVRNLSH